MRYIIETQVGRLWGPFTSAAKAERWAKKNLTNGLNHQLNAFKIRPIHQSRPYP